jgi:peptidoglycan/LPS O-acetylase OafA/YrhL
MNAKTSRLVTTTLLGLVTGIICMIISKFGYDIEYWPLGVSFLLHHTVMGLAIGASSLRMTWAPHGLFWGGVFGLFLAISLIDTNTDLEPWGVFIIVVIWGLLIETLTTKAFKRPQP